jgi:hypothetical protein
MPLSQLRIEFLPASTHKTALIIICPVDAKVKGFFAARFDARLHRMGV